MVTKLLNSKILSSFLLGKVLLVFLFASIAPTISAQNKLGHINSQVLLSLMPERDSLAKQLEDYSLELQQQIQALEQEYNVKLQDYLDKRETMQESIRTDKEQELSSLQQRMQTFQQVAQQDMQKKQQELLEPLLEKANNAIQEVAKDNGFTYVFDTSVGSIVYVSEDTIDILPLVREKLNI